MAGYESDSSGLSDQEEYTETNVLLGYSSKEPTDDTISHLGGHPKTWLDSEKTPPGSYAKCKVCQSNMSLLLQLNGDLPEHFPNDERRLYIFSCRRKACDRKLGSIRALREVRRTKVDKPVAQAKNAAQPAAQTPQQDLGASLFGSTAKSPQPSGNGNPFSTTSTSATASPVNPFSPLPPTSSLAALTPQAPVEESPSIQQTLPETFASKLKLASGPSSKQPSQPEDNEPWPPQASFPSPYPNLHLDADYEALSPTALTKEVEALASSSKIQYDDETTSSSSSNVNLKDSFESAIDKTFLKFSDRLAQNPEQVLRYEWKGAPLLYSSTDAVASYFPSLAAHPNPSKISTSASSQTTKIPRCPSCSSPRIFELQLVPGLIAALEEDDESTMADIDSGMEWGTILLGVCERNCGTEGKEVGSVAWREEWAGVQWEERVSRK